MVRIWTQPEVYSMVQKSLSAFAVLSLIMIILTLVYGTLVWRNFGRGLRASCMSILLTPTNDLQWIHDERHGNRSGRSGLSSTPSRLLETNLWRIPSTASLSTKAGWTSTRTFYPSISFVRMEIHCFLRLLFIVVYMLPHASMSAHCQSVLSTSHKGHATTYSFAARYGYSACTARH